MSGNFMKPLDPPISLADVKVKSKRVRKGRNRLFGLTVDVLYKLGVFEKPHNKQTAELLYGQVFDPDTGDDPGYNRLMDQRCGRKSFIADEEHFWKKAIAMGLGSNIAALYDHDVIVRTPIGEIFERARNQDLALPWDQIDPVLALNILASTQGDDRRPARLTMAEVKNARLTSLGGQAPAQFYYSEIRSAYRIGQEFRLSVGSLRPNEDFVVVEFAHQPFREERDANEEFQAQHMPDRHRVGDASDAIIVDAKGNDVLFCGEYGQLSGAHGFCIVTFPKRDDGSDPFSLRGAEDLLSLERFQTFIAVLRREMHMSKELTLNVIEYDVTM